LKIFGPLKICRTSTRESSNRSLYSLGTRQSSHVTPFLEASPTMHSAARLLLRCGARRSTCCSPSPALVLSCDGLGCRPTDIRGWNGNLKAGARAFCVQGAHSSVFQPPGDADDASGFMRGKDKGFRVEGLGYRVKGLGYMV
jgi:hypothetical protein